MVGSDVPPTNHLEIRVCGLQRSGNHAIIIWMLDQHSGAPVCFLNNVRHGDHDPYLTALRTSTEGLGETDDVEQLRSATKQVLLYSYEDDAGQMQDEDILASVYDREFEERRHQYLGRSGHFSDVIIMRDPFNFFASRLQRLDSLTGVKDPGLIARNWKRLAEESLRAMESGDGSRLVVRFNDWFDSRPYREELSKRLLGRFSDTTLHAVPKQGGGSSFESKGYNRLTFGMIRAKWKKLLDPRTYLNAPEYVRRLFLPAATSMKVLERWRLYKDDPQYRAIFRDPEILELSETIFGVIPGTRSFVADCRSQAVG